MKSVLLKQPSGFIPITMSLAALSVIAVHVSMLGVAPQADEGAAAHLWQILMAGQLPVVAFFAINWLPKAPKECLFVLAVQFAAALSAMFPVWWYHW